VDDNDALIAELTQAALTTAAPDELAVFDETAQEYFDDPQAALTAAKGDAAVGFGLELAMLTPVALAIGSAVFQAVIDQVSGRAIQAGQRGVVGLLRKVLRREAPPAELGLTPAQAQHLKLVALQQAHALGLPEAQARLLADSFVGALVTGQ
jgi:hypothetical protein